MQANNEQLMAYQDILAIAEQLNITKQQFLTDNELEEITGYKAPYKQIEWLRSNGWSFIVNAANHPVVHRSIMLIKLGVCIPDQNQQSNKSTWKPDLTKVS